VIISTWQSASVQPVEWFDQFKVVIGDEAHRYKATSLKYIMESLTNCPYRFGLTGTLDDVPLNQLTIEGLFGPKHQIVTSRDLINMGYNSEMDIQALVLNYPDPIRKAHAKDDYQTEISFLCTNSMRNRYIENLALTRKGNTILLFQRVQEHGKPLFESLSKKCKVPIYYVSGEVEGQDREEIRQIVDKHENSLIVASVGTFSTGIDIPSINNIIVASPTKSIIRVVQTIGRGLRKTKTKDRCVLFDIADNLQWKNRKNYTLKHFTERMKIYIRQDYNYKLHQIELKEK
jgi:superfamily II DNA or RNA helicase